MKTLSISSVFIAVVMLVPMFSSVAHAADFGGSDGWSDYGTYDTWSDYGTSDTWSDYGSYDTWSDYGTSDTWSDYGTYDDWSDYGTYGGGTYHDDVSSGGTYYDDVPGTYYDDVVGNYYDDYGYGNYGSYDYGCGSSCGGSYSTPSYSTPGCSFCGGGTSYSPPRYTPPVVSQPGYASSNINTNTVTNTNTNVNNVTNIDNSIRDSFNNYNSNNTSLVVAQPQTPIVYHQPAPYCTINHALGGGSYNYNNNSAYISWSSQNASSAFLSNVGSVNVSGSQNVYPGYTTTYTLTVYGHNGQSATCSTTVQANNYVPPTYYPPVVQQPYVALTQIPYTGFDFGPIGNAIYWASLLSFAAAGAYLALYFRGGMFALAGNMVPARASRRSSQAAFSPVAPKAPLLIEKEIVVAIAEHKVQPVVAALRKNGTIDAMAIVTSKDGSMPMIVIERN